LPRSPAPDLVARRRVRGLALAALAVALALAACGSDDPAPSSSSPESQGSGKSQEVSGVVEDQIGFDTAGILARQSRAEGLVRDCMKNEGFDYIPVDPLARRAALTGSSRLSDEDFLQQFGYGISTFWGKGTMQADPNQRLRASLAPADRRAYDRALWGENKGASFTEAVDTGNFTRLGGCTRESTEAVFGGAQVLTQLQRRLDGLDDRILEDQRMVRALEDWAGCMTEAGFEYEEPDEIDSDLIKRMEAIVGPLPGEMAVGPAPGETPKPYDRAALAELQREEVAIARADFACEEKHIVPVENVVRPQYEAQFRRQNRGLLSQVKPVPK
jgi:hypothetical protein